MVVRTSTALRENEGWMSWERKERHWRRPEEGAAMIKTVVTPTVVVFCLLSLIS
jgi:hypothetical protein